MSGGQRQHEITDKVWLIVEPLLPGQAGQWGGVAYDNRRFLNGVFWVLRTGAPWRDLPPAYGKWGTVYQRFHRWRAKGIWETVLERLMDQPEYEWLIIDTGYMTTLPHTAEATDGDSDISYTPRGSVPRFLWPWMRMICRSESLLQKLPQRLIHRLPT